MAGYWNKPEETESAFVGRFFRTGDVGYMDEEGFIFIVDRIKDMINASGFKVYPRRIEDVLYEHPAVEEVTVIGIPDAYRGEAPKAFVKLKEGERATQAELHRVPRPRLSKIELPAEIEFRDELPKTLVGKHSKKELRAERSGEKPIGLSARTRRPLRSAAREAIAGRTLLAAAFGFDLRLLGFSRDHARRPPLHDADSAASADSVLGFGLRLRAGRRRWPSLRRRRLLRTLASVTSGAGVAGAGVAATGAGLVITIMLETLSPESGSGSA